MMEIIPKKKKYLTNNGKLEIIIDGDLYMGDMTDLDALNSSYVAMPVDKMYAEKFIHFITDEEITVILLSHLGYTPAEIIKTMKLKSIKELYAINKQFKTHVRLFALLNKMIE